jgi:hypothetical protein
MQTPTVITAVCLLMPVLVLQFRLISGHTIIDQHEGIEGNEAEPRALKSESVLMGIANSLIGGKTKGTTGGGQVQSNRVLLYFLNYAYLSQAHKNNNLALLYYCNTISS